MKYRVTLRIQAGNGPLAGTMYITGKVVYSTIAEASDHAKIIEKEMNAAGFIVFSTIYEDD